MRRPVADEYRLRLEGRAELLESARLRYRAVLEMLGAKLWEERLRKDLAPLREVMEGQARVEEALASALRRAQAEAWPSTSPTVQLLRDVQALREKLAQTVAQRLSRGAKDSLPALLKELEEWVLTVPREIPPGERWATALALLPEELPLLKELASFGRLLATLFSRPFDPEERLPFRVDEVDALRRQWSSGEVALAQAWSRLSKVDQAGGLVTDLRKRAERAPLRPPTHGPERLLHAEFWRSVARKRLETLVRVRIRPVEPTPSECVKLAWWLFACEVSPDARLPSSEVASEARAGLIELAHELRVLLRTESPGDPPPLSDEAWEVLRERARRADLVNQGSDAERVRDVLRTFIWKRGMGNAGMRGWRELPASLEALVEHAWRVDR